MGAVQDFTKDIEAYLSWCEDLEAQVHAQGCAMNRSRWFYSERLNVYTRCGWSYLPSGPATSVVLANIEVAEAYQGQGLVARLLDRLEGSEVKLRAQFVVVEQVLNPRFAQALARRGYVARTPMEGGPTLFRARTL